MLRPLRRCWHRHDPANSTLSSCATAATTVRRRRRGSSRDEASGRTAPPVLSKVAALNLGDHHATTSTRVYVDADVKLSTKSLHRLLEALDDGALVAAPRPASSLTGCSMAVRMYASVWTRLWHVTRGLGSGVYAISPAGRSAFDEFPDVIADDYFVFCTYPGGARVSPPDAVSIVRPPRTLGHCAPTRTHRARECRTAVCGIDGGTGTLRSGFVVRAAAAPWLAPTAALYAGVHLWARRGSTSGGQDRVWRTDASSRSATAERRTV